MATSLDQRPLEERPRREGVLRRLVRRATSSDEELVAEALQAQAAACGAASAGRCGDRQRVTLRGRLTSVLVNPPGDAKSLQAQFDDGSAVVTLIWMGRRTIPGIVAGAELMVTGRLGSSEQGLVIYNPDYELVSVPS